VFIEQITARRKFSILEFNEKVVSILVHKKGIDLFELDIYMDSQSKIKSLLKFLNDLTTLSSIYSHKSLVIHRLYFTIDTPMNKDILSKLPQYKTEIPMGIENMISLVEKLKLDQNGLDNKLANNTLKDMFEEQSVDFLQYYYLESITNLKSVIEFLKICPISIRKFDLKMTEWEEIKDLSDEDGLMLLQANISPQLISSLHFVVLNFPNDFSIKRLPKF
jgi:hypothetical protein